MSDELKIELKSAGFTFLTVFIGAILPHIDTMTLVTLKDGTLLALLGAALRAGLKASFSVIMLAFKTYNPKQPEHE